MYTYIKKGSLSEMADKAKLRLAGLVGSTWKHANHVGGWVGLEGGGAPKIMPIIGVVGNNKISKRYQNK